MSINKLADVIRYAEADTSLGIAKAIEDHFVVIDRNDLPEVERVVMRSKHSGTFRFKDSLLERVNFGDDHLLLALAHLAAAEHMAAQVDLAGKAVESLANDLAVALDRDHARDLARRLVADGWKREVTS